MTSFHFEWRHFILNDTQDEEDILGPDQALRPLEDDRPEDGDPHGSRWFRRGQRGVPGRGGTPGERGRLERGEEHRAEHRLVLVGPASRDAEAGIRHLEVDQEIDRLNALGDTVDQWKIDVEWYSVEILDTKLYVSSSNNDTMNEHVH